MESSGFTEYNLGASPPAGEPPSEPNETFSPFHSDSKSTSQYHCFQHFFQPPENPGRAVWLEGREKACDVGEDGRRTQRAPECRKLYGWLCPPRPTPIPRHVPTITVNEQNCFLKDKRRAGRAARTPRSGSLGEASTKDKMLMAENVNYTQLGKALNLPSAEPGRSTGACWDIWER
ncbi:hypothetical protein U0070_024576 [Myodes glareolus]|uniref:Uncharacterized protein n=1 Tax=Myodes glareolus TaxID=447135 RepID=A0AAW0ID30_MYOGA